MEKVTDSLSDTAPFVEVSNVCELVPVLEKRLPIASVVYNCAVMYPRFKDIVKFYTLFGDIDESSWIVAQHYREDFGRDYLISANKDKLKVSEEEAKRILSECGLFDWNESYFFSPEENWLSDIIFYVSCTMKGRITEVHPCHLFYMDIRDALQLDATPKSNGVSVQKLDPVKGVDFILKTWFYTKEGTEAVVRKGIDRNESAGVYIEGKPVAGVYTLGFGLISALYTLPEHRNKGYAKLTMNFLFKELAKSGIIPALWVENFNDAGFKFHKNLGCKVGGTFYNVLHSKVKL